MNKYNNFNNSSETCLNYSNRIPKQCITLRDHGPMPYVVNIHEAANQNYNFRLALWTGSHLQLTLMNVHAGEDVGLEMHPDVDQFLRVEEGQGLTLMGNCQNNLWFQKKVYPGSVILVPAGSWHNIINTGCTPLKLYSIYAPPEHPFGTIHPSKKDSDMDHHSY